MYSLKVFLLLAVQMTVLVQGTTYESECTATAEEGCFGRPCCPSIPNIHLETVVNPPRFVENFNPKKPCPTVMNPFGYSDKISPDTLSEGRYTRDCESSNEDCCCCCCDDCSNCQCHKCCSGANCQCHKCRCGNCQCHKCRCNRCCGCCKHCCRYYKSC